MNIDRELQAQTPMARKVYSVVPEIVAQPMHAIYGALKEKGTRITMPVFEACLHTLREAKLIREVAGEYIRTPKRAYTKQPKPQEDHPVKPTAQVVTPITQVAPVVAPSSLLMLTDLEAKLLEAAGMVEGIITQIKNEQAASSEAANKLAQLRNVLKEI